MDGGAAQLLQGGGTEGHCQDCRQATHNKKAARPPDSGGQVPTPAHHVWMAAQLLEGVDGGQGGQRLVAIQLAPRQRRCGTAHTATFIDTSAGGGCVGAWVAERGLEMCLFASEQCEEALGRAWVQNSHHAQDAGGSTRSPTHSYSTTRPNHPTHLPLARWPGSPCRGSAAGRTSCRR